MRKCCAALVPGSWATLLGLALLLASPAARAFDVFVESASLMSSQDGPVDASIDVWVVLGSGETPPDVSGFQAAVNLDFVGAGLDFVSPFAEPTPAGPHAPLISTNFAPDFGGDNFEGRASATAFLDSGTTPIVDGAGLFRVPLRIDRGAAGVFTVTVDLDPIAGTVFADGNGDPVPFTVTDGVITVDRPPKVPALSLIGVLLLAALLIGASVWALHHSRAS